MPLSPSANSSQSIAALIKTETYSLGFDSCAIIAPTQPPHYSIFEKWVNAGLHAGMTYLASDRSLALRQDPTLLLPGCQSIIIVTASYPQVEPDLNPEHGIIAAYALVKDYHLILPGKLETLCHTISDATGIMIKSASYTDSAPILERDLAGQAGLGWMGKNACLISPKFGSFFFLAELMTDIPLESDPPLAREHCGSCTRCIQACPTACILPNRTIDSNRCIAYHTIENKGIIPVELRSLFGNRVFGCDICQFVCPWNQKSAARELILSQHLRSDLGNPNLMAELALDDPGFKQKYKDTPVLRAKRRGYLRNVCIALGNSRIDTAVPALADCLENEVEPLIRAHAAWALGQLKNKRSSAALQNALLHEMDLIVKNEIESALASKI